MSLSRCKSCKAAIVWLETKNGRKMPVDSSTVRPGETRFLESSAHVPHWMTCPNAKNHKKPSEATTPKPAPARPEDHGQLSLLDAPSASGEGRLPAGPGGYVTQERAAQLRNLLKENNIPGEAFRAIREAAGYTAPVETWDEEMYHDVMALAIHTATCLQATQHGLPAYLQITGCSPEEVAAAQAEYDKLVGPRRVG